LTTVWPELDFPSGANQKLVVPISCSMPSAYFTGKTISPFGSHLWTALCEEEKDKFELIVKYVFLEPVKKYRSLVQNIQMKMSFSVKNWFFKLTVQVCIQPGSLMGIMRSLFLMRSLTVLKLAWRSFVTQAC